MGHPWLSPSLAAEPASAGAAGGGWSVPPVGFPSEPMDNSGGGWKQQECRRCEERPAARGGWLR